MLRQLSRRLCCEADFPHEIGVFLGYPLYDVVGFIENQGRNFTCCGCWKAYGDPDAAQQHFAQLNKCTAVYLRLFHERNAHPASGCCSLTPLNLTFSSKYSLLSWRPPEQTTHWREEVLLLTRGRCCRIDHPAPGGCVISGSVKEKNRKYVQTIANLCSET